MARIKCPHCGAGNRDSQESRTCWQCGKNLWEAAERRTYALSAHSNLPGTTALDPSAINLLMDTTPKKATNTSVLVAALVCILSGLIFVATWLTFARSSESPAAQLGSPSSAVTR